VIFCKKNKFTFAASRLRGLALKIFLTGLFFLAIFSNVFAQKSDFPASDEKLPASENIVAKKDERTILLTKAEIVEDEMCGDCIIEDPIFKTPLLKKIFKVIAKPFTVMGKILK